MGFAAGFSAGSSAVGNALSIRDARAQREAELGLRRAQENRDATRFAAEQARETQVGDAIGSLQALQGGIVSGADFSTLPPMSDAGPTQPPAGGLRPQGGTARFATPLEMNQGMQKVALAQRDMRGFGELAGKASTLEEDDLFKQGMKKGFDPEMAKWVNGNHKSITVGAPDKNGISQLSVVRPDGDAVFHSLSKSDQAQLAGAMALMDRNPMRALQIIGGVNKELAAVLAAENNLTLNVSGKNNDAAKSSAAIGNDAQRTANDGARVGLERERLGIARQVANNAERRAGDREQMERMGQVRLYKNPQTGAVEEHYPVTTKAGIQWRKVPSPEGMVPVRVGEKPAPNRVQEKLADAYATEVVTARTPADQEKVRSKYRSLGLQELGEDPILSALRQATGGQGPAGAPAAVPGRPFYDADSRELQRVARKPRGVSTEEANAARLELEQRQNEPRMSAY